MADDVAMPLNPLVAPIEQEELKEAPLDVNVSQRPHEEKTVQASGVHSSQSFSMGSSIVS
jgi:hypothetical protein